METESYKRKMGDESSSNGEEFCSDSSSSDTSSEYSDWMAVHGESLEPPKRSKRKPVQKRPATLPSDSDRRRSQRPKKKQVVVPMEEEPSTSTMTELPEKFRPSEWLSETIPKKTPYYPQMGDEVVYFRQGHQRYFDTVRSKKIYSINRSSEPWRKLDLKAQEFARVVGIKYEIKPPRLCSVKLQQLDEEGLVTGKFFTIKYHDMPDVLDFIVLRQTFDLALERNWTKGNRFRCVIDDGWWTGQIMSVQPLSEEFPDSYFLCFLIRWGSGEYEYMSPWDLEPIDEQRLPTEVGGVVEVLPEEIRDTLYQPRPEEWPMGDRESACRRIIRGLDQVMTLAYADPFLVPTDLDLYPSYAMIVEYPIDLTMIKTRFENRFYRRIVAAKFDVRYLATNAEAFNEKNSLIVKQARIITEICLKIINKEGIEYEDVTALYHEIADGYRGSDSGVDVAHVDISQPSTSLLSRSWRSGSHASPSKHVKTQNFSKDWRIACRQLLEKMWQCKDSMPFRTPVDRLEHPDYHQIIDTPMDLQTVREELLGGNYESPNDFAKDVKLIFSNSRLYNTIKKSKIYCMTMRLLAMFKELIHGILNSWKWVSRRNANNNANARNKSSRPKRLINGAGLSKKPRKAISDASSDEEEDDDEQPKVPSQTKRQPTRSHDEAGPLNLVNSYSKRQAASSQTRNKQKVLPSSDNETENSSPSASEALSEDEGRPKRKTRSRNAQKASDSDLDSDDSDEYVPSAKGKQSKNNRVKNSATAAKKTRTNRTPEKRQQAVQDSENDDGDDDTEEENEADSDIGTRSDDDEEYVEVSRSGEDGRSMRPRGQLANGNDNSDDSDSDESYEMSPRSIRQRNPIYQNSNLVPRKTRNSRELGCASCSPNKRYCLRNTGIKRTCYTEKNSDEEDDDEVNSSSAQAKSSHCSTKRPHYGNA